MVWGFEHAFLFLFVLRFLGKAALACVVFEEALLCVRTFDAFVTRRRTARDLRDDIIRHIPLKNTSLSRFPLRGKAFFGSTTTHFLRGLLLSRLSFFLPF